MNNTLNVLEQAWKVCRDAYLQALLTLPKTTEEKIAAIKKVCKLELLPATIYREEIFSSKFRIPGVYLEEVLWRDYWYEDRYRVFDLEDIIDYAEELCQVDGKTKVVTSKNNEYDVTLSFDEIVEVIFDWMIIKKARGITNDW